MEKKARNRLVRTLHEMELKLSTASIDELIRLIGSSHFQLLTPEQIRNVGEYQTIEIEGERYFERAFSPGKEASTSLALAHMIGREEALADLLNLRACLCEAA
jgi:hypothetical protein